MATRASAPLPPPPTTPCNARAHHRSISDLTFPPLLFRPPTVVPWCHVILPWSRCCPCNLLPPALPIYPMPGRQICCCPAPCPKLYKPNNAEDAPATQPGVTLSSVTTWTGRWCAVDTTFFALSSWHCCERLPCTASQMATLTPPWIRAGDGDLPGQGGTSLQKINDKGFGESLGPAPPLP